MAGRTLFDLFRDDFGFTIGAGSDGAVILASMTLVGVLAPDGRGRANVGALTLEPTPTGVRPRAAAPGDAMVFDLPGGAWDFGIATSGASGEKLSVKITLLSPQMALPFLRPGSLEADGTLAPATGTVHAIFPKCLLEVTAMRGNSGSTARLLPTGAPSGSLEVSFEPPNVFLGPGTVLGLGLPRATLDLDAPGGAVLRLPEVRLFLEPPGIAALAMSGSGQGLTLEFGNGGGLSGDLSVSGASGAAAAGRPRFIRDINGRVKLRRNTVLLLSVEGTVELSQEIARVLGAEIGDTPGLLDYRLALALDGAWTATLALGGSGQTFLWRSKRGEPHDASPFRDAMGAYAVFAPLLASSLPGAGTSGVVDLALGSGAAASLAASGFVTTRRLTVLGAELSVRQRGAGPPDCLLFFDVETELDLDVKFDGLRLIGTRKPITVRQKAVGLRLDFGANGASPKLHPVFDPLQGFDLDLSDPGTFDAPPPLGDFLQPDAARMARDNPLVFEIDLVTKADLGPVTIDRAGVRVPLEGGMPSLTGLGAHLNMGLVNGGGHIRLLPSGIEGGFDAAIAPPLGLRVSGRLHLETSDPAPPFGDLIQVLVGLRVKLPVPIPLANSGLGLFGFLGLLAVNRRRDQPEGTSPLDWLVQAGGDPGSDTAAWTGQRGGFALGVGAVLGTLEGGFLFNAEGMLMVELPGPRVLIVMKANVMQPPPSLGGDVGGLLLAVIEVSADGISIGIYLNYGIPFLLEVEVPVESWFSFDDPADWQFDAGSVEKRVFVSVRFMTFIRADGYFMIHGNGIQSPLHALQGFAVAAGIEAALTWGPVPIGLYVRVAVGADVGISYKPVLMIGRVTLEGELRLFIVSIGCKASAIIRITGQSFYVRARIEGRVEFFFFEVSGGVTFELGDKNLEMPAAEPLLRGLSLHARSHALLPGQGADGPIDVSLGDATAGGEPLLIVPIDAIPVLQFEMRAHIGPDASFEGRHIPALLAKDAWVRRGERFYRYTVTSVSVEATDADGKPHAAPFQDGDKPVAWWDRHSNPASGEDSNVQLALLNWIPDPTPAAALRTKTRDTQIKSLWGTVCAEVADEAGVLWTFHGKAAGASVRGWTITGITWPDKSDKVRSTPPPTRLRITEPWRTGTLVDALMKAGPAQVVVQGGARVLLAPRTERFLRPRVDGDPAIQQVIDHLPPADLGDLADAIRLDTNGLRHIKGLVSIGQKAGRLLLRARGADGLPTGFEKEIEPDSVAFDQLPPPWQDQDGPWAAHTQPLFGFAGRPPSFFELELDAKTAAVDIGFIYDSPSEEQNGTERWALLAVELITEAEIARRDFDEARQRDRVSTVNGALAADESMRALMHPESTYAVSVDYEVVTANADDTGELDSTTIGQPAKRTQSYRFATDEQPPQRLESLVLATSPAEGEESFFYRDPIRMVFSTRETRKLFKSYGKRLYAVAKAASGNHPPSIGGLSPGTVLLEAPAISVKPIVALAMAPFESALRTALAGHCCVNLTFSANRHEAVTIPLELAPSTGYVLDMEARGPGGASPPPQLEPLLRRSFRTSRYGDVASFAADIRSRPHFHRHLPDVAALTRLPAGKISDIACETALRDAGWGGLDRIVEPRTTLIWTGAASSPALPAAVLIEAPERLWRERIVPVEKTADGVTAYVRGSQQWLSVADRSEPQTVTRLVWTSGGTRMIAILQPSARGKLFRLDLVRTGHRLFEGDVPPSPSEMASVRLAAPWEATT
ncbi:MAG: hypothetical protein NTV73_08170 [Hyphomicrobiales bacterium]|nr:hypothetical protein [Hyphomicrobiales bacterium]